MHRTLPPGHPSRAPGRGSGSSPGRMDTGGGAGLPRLGGLVVSCRRPLPIVLQGLHELVSQVHGRFPSWSAGHGSVFGTIRRPVVRAVGDAYTAAPGNWASATRPVRHPGGVYTGWK
jgi:hypothetical protein